jgi:hypothetical protein
MNVRAVLPLVCVGALALVACRQDAPPPGASAPPGVAATPTKARSAQGAGAFSLVVEGEHLQVGFARDVRLRAKVSPRQPQSSVDTRGWRFRWRELAPSRSTLAPAKTVDGAELSLRTIAAPSASQLAGQQAHGVVALSAAMAGRRVFEVIARGPHGRQLREVIEIVPAYPSANWPRAARGVDVYLLGQGWQLGRTFRLLEAGRTAGHLTRARWVARSAAWQRATHPALSAGHEGLTIRGGPWLGSHECGRYDCHPREQAGWRRTRHASVFQRGVDGKLASVHDARGPYRRDCASCHTLGDQPGAQNGGFDDRQRKSGWRFPARAVAGSYAAMPRELRARANVQCEHCHGPGWFYTSLGDDICAQCHDRPPFYRTVQQLSQTRMAQTHLVLDAKVRGDSSKVCGQCHTAAGFVASLRGHRSTSVPRRDRSLRQNGVTCATCHDPHGNDCAKQLRLCGPVEVPGKTFDAGQGALCIACHSGEAGVTGAPGTLHRPFRPGQPRKAGQGGHARPTSPSLGDPLAAPHAPQFQLLSGRGGRFLSLGKTGARRAKLSYPHLEVPQSCVGCHYDRASRRKGKHGGHSFSLRQVPQARPRVCLSKRLAAYRRGLAASKRTATCTKCHGTLATLGAAKAKGDYDGDGRVEGLVEEVDGLMTLLQRELRGAIAALKLSGQARVKDATVSSPAVGFTVFNEQIVAADSRCRALRTLDGKAPLAFHPAAPLVQKAAHNFLLVLRDGSFGLHNPQYTVRLLQDAILGLEQRRGAKKAHRWKPL